VSLIDYNLRMLAIKTTDEFDAWLDALRDRLAQRRIVARLRKASAGLLGDVGPWARVYRKCASTLGRVIGFTSSNMATFSS
jgi:hypothetical protein